MTLRCMLMAALALVVAGCGDDGEACALVCAKNAECQPDGPGEETCRGLCEQQSEDEAYAEAIEAQAECYDQGWTCADLAGGVCSNPN